MNKKWETREVSTPEHIFDKIKEEMAQPVGIILIGTRCRLKDEVMREVLENLITVYVFPNAPDEDSLEDAIKSNPMVMVVLSPWESSRYSLRCTLINTMRSAGVKTVVGIYVKANKLHNRYSKPSLFKKIKLKMQAVAIELSNPTADNLDHSIMVMEKRRG